MKYMQKVLVIGTVLLVTGCQTASQRSASSPVLPRQAGVSENLGQSGIRYETKDARIAKLWSAAERARREGNTDLALQRLFDGIEIQPQNSLLWSRAAEIQLNNEQAALAENFAAKSNTFAGNNGSLLHRNWLIIEHARSLRGDLLGVRSAHKKVQEYQYR
ncbi:MAG: hypothetical protein KTR32_19235 [Granulosicoccus sp.]|nr:hypothetical protein [Granulosicoccus sp.]